VSPFESYRGIGNPGLGSGREAVTRRVRNPRGGLLTLDSGLYAAAFPDLAIERL
jgi:hypothetical protein